MENAPEALTPIYFSEEVNEAISLFSGEVSLEYKEGSISGLGEVEVAWFPSVNIILKATFEEYKGIDSSLLLDSDFFKINIPKLKASFEAFALEVTISESLYLHACLKGYNAGFGISTEVNSIIFHVPNFAKYHGSPSGLDLRAKEWCVSLDIVSQGMVSIKDLKQRGGIGITHVGKITRIDGDPFQFEEAHRLLLGLKKFLSFVRGRTVAPMLLAGLDADDKIIWNEWRVEYMESWGDSISWFDYFLGHSLGSIFSGFMERWFDDEWKYTVSNLLYWYVASNSLGRTDAAIILTQTALEELAWTILVLKRKALDKQGLKRLNTSSRLRLCLNILEVPTHVPDSLQSLSALARERNHADGPEIFVQIRNDIVHPYDETSVPLKTHVEAWNLGQWYLELALLRLFKYNGDYSNRLRSPTLRGEVEPLPRTQHDAP